MCNHEKEMFNDVCVEIEKISSAEDVGIIEKFRKYQDRKRAVQ